VARGHFAGIEGGFDIAIALLPEQAPQEQHVGFHVVHDEDAGIEPGLHAAILSSEAIALTMASTLRGLVS